MKKFWKTKTGKPASPNDGELLAFLDGELPPSRQAEIRQLLENDWSLRVRLGELERDIAAYVSATHPPGRAASGADVPPFDDLWRNVKARAAQESMTRQPAGSRLLRVRWQQGQAWLQQPTQLRLALSAGITLLLAAGLAFWLLRSERVSVVSAEELMQRATQSEAKSLLRVGDPVVYRKIQLRRAGSPETVQWESWKEARHAGQFRQRIADPQGWRFVRGNDAKRPALLTELEAVLRANQFDAERPLSATVFAHWRKQLRQFSDTVLDQRESWRLTTTAAAPHAIHAIKAASLLVRKSDWHALSLQLQVQGENEVREYELSEIAYDVLPLQALTVFADLAPPPASITSAPSIVAATVAPSLSPSAPLPSAAALQEAEVNALHTLHQLRADLGEQLEIVRSANGPILVRGVVETTARKEELVSALNRLPLVTTQIQSVEEAQRATAQTTEPSLQASSSVNPPAGSTEKQAQPQLFRVSLERFLASSGNSPAQTAERITQITNESLALSERSLSQAWALRRLAENPALRSVENLSPEAKARLLAMLAGHQQGLHEQLRGLRRELVPALSYIADGSGSAGVAPTVIDWSGAAQAVFQSVARLDRLLHRVLSSDGITTTPAQAARDSLTALMEAEAALRQLENQIGQLSVNK
jgi:anti-sigma factor RsiW